MWLLDNSTPFAAERTWVRDQDGAEEWIVGVKASFTIEKDGRQVLDADQTQIARVPEFRGEPGLSSLLCDSDLVHTKSRTDVLVHGHAYSPEGTPATRVDVRLKVANIDKTLRVYGDRLIERGLSGINLSSPKPFSRLPITYERSFGGTDQKDEDAKRHRWEARNPVGVGFATQKEHIVGTPAPNVEDPESPYCDWRKGKPAGFGPIARHWSPRVELAGTYDEAWEKDRSPLLPSDFDGRFYQCSPEDQQVPGFLKGGELVELHNLTPEGYFYLRLPRVTLGMTTRFYDGTVTRHRANLHTLFLMPDGPRFTMVWQSQLPCHSKVNRLEETQVILKHRLRVPPEEEPTGVWIPESDTR